MSYVALFRNLNLGHPGSPTKQVLLEAFSGSSVASSFQTNGTVIFEAEHPEEVVSQARSHLDAAGFRQNFVVRTLAHIASLVDEAPEVDPSEDVYRLMVSFYDATVMPHLSPPVRSFDDIVEIRSICDLHAWSACWKPKNTAGNVTGFLESLLHVPVTTRTAGTLERLTRKYPRASGSRVFSSQVVS